MKKNILILVAIILILVGSMYYYVSEPKRYHTVKVYIEVNGTLDHVNGTGITLGDPESTYFVRDLGRNKLLFPGMSVALLAMPDMDLLTSWRNVPYNGSGKYVIELDLKRNFQDNEWIRVINYIYSSKGSRINAKIKDFKIQYNQSNNSEIQKKSKYLYVTNNTSE